MFSWPVRY